MTAVLHVIPGLDPAQGGTVAALLSMAVFQARQGLNVTVASMYTADHPPPRDLERRLRDVNVDVRFIGPARGPLLWHAGLSRTLAPLVAAADVVHAHGVWEEIQHRAAALARRHRVPYVISPHGMLDPFNLSKKWLKKRLYLTVRLRRTLSGAAAIHFTDEVERDVASPVTAGPPALVEPIGIDVSEFANPPRRGTFRSKYPQVGNRPIVLFMGRLHPKKAPEVLVEAFARLPMKEPVLVMAGPDEDGYRATLESAVRRHGLQDRTIFTGMLRGPERLAALSEADLFALFSHQENFGLAVVEALACGTPVLISDGVNIHRRITEAGVGGVAPVRAADVAALLEKWLNDADLRRGAAARARDFVTRHYDATEVAARWARHYAALAGARGGRPQAAVRESAGDSVDSPVPPAPAAERGS